MLRSLILNGYSEHRTKWETTTVMTHYTNIEKNTSAKSFYYYVNLLRKTDDGSSKQEKIASAPQLCWLLMICFNIFVRMLIRFLKQTTAYQKEVRPYWCFPEVPSFFAHDKY